MKSMTSLHMSAVQCRALAVACRAWHTWQPQRCRRICLGSLMLCVQPSRLQAPTPVLHLACLANSAPPSSSTSSALIPTCRSLAHLPLPLQARHHLPSCQTHRGPACCQLRAAAHDRAESVWRLACARILKTARSALLGVRACVWLAAGICCVLRAQASCAGQLRLGVLQAAPSAGAS